MKTLIVIPARFASTRLPGKPLLQLAGKSMLQRVCEIADNVKNMFSDVQMLVATDDERIYAHAEKIGVNCVVTKKDCATGSERVLAAVEQLGCDADFVVNLQGDAPLIPVAAVEQLISTAKRESTVQVVTAAVKLSWPQLDDFREHKKISPFSGTSIIVDKESNGIWFSKNIIPAIRNEAKVKGQSSVSPVYRHFGIYGYRYSVLKEYVKLSQTSYEKLEGLEQLRLLENGYKIRVVPVAWEYPEIVAGIDTIEDARKAEEFLKKTGDEI